MAPLKSHKFIRALLAAAMVMSLSSAPVYAGGEGGGRGENIVNVGKGGLKAKRGKKAAPKKWVVKDRTGKTTYKIEKSRISKKFIVSKYGRDVRTGKNKPTHVKSFSKRQLKKISKYDTKSNTTTVRVKLDGKVRSITVSGDVVGA